MKANRDVTTIINYVLDNLLPPVLRDFYPLMYPIYRLAYGKDTKKLLHYKDQYAPLNREEIAEYYECAAKTSLASRPTDLNHAGIRFVFDNVVPGGTCLDVGCGRGWLAQQLARRGFSVTGLDILPPSQFAEKEFVFVEGTLDALPFDENQFDTVICAHVLEHVDNLDRAFAELLRVTGNTLLIVLPRQREYRWAADLHVHYFPYLYNVQMAFPAKNAIISRVGSDWGILIRKKF